MLPKADWKEIISRKVQKKKTFEYLTELKATHSKSRNNIKNPSFRSISDLVRTIQKKLFILATRTRMINIKGKSDLQKELERDRNSRTSCKLQEEEKKRHSEL